MPASKKKLGFTLVEMSVVLMIIGVVVAGGVVMGVKLVRDTQEQVTRSRMDTIDAAMLNFRKVNNRLPCPADGTTVVTNTNFGREAATPGTCIGGTPTANFTSGNIVEGVVPTKSLNLPDDFMFDGWGRRISYAIDIRHTAASAFFNYAVTDTCTDAIRIDDGVGGTRSRGGIYLILSHGPTGHGGYLRTGSGTRYNSASTNADSLENCDCTAANTSTPSTTAFDGIYIQKNVTNDPVSMLNGFDDIVRFKERWQLEPEGIVGPTSYPTSWPSLAMGVQNAPYLHLFRFDPTGETFTLMPTPATTPTGWTFGAKFSPNNLYLATGHYNAPYLTVYKRSCGPQMVKLPDANFSPAIPGAVGEVEFSHDGKYLAVAHQNGAYLTVYSVTGDTFTGLTLTGGTPNNYGLGLSFSKDDSYLAVSNYSPTGIISAIYQKQSNTYSRIQLIDESATTTQYGWGISFSNDIDSKYLAIGLWSTCPQAKIYDGKTFATGSTPQFTPGPAPTVGGGCTLNSAMDVKFSPNGGLVAVSTTAAPKIQVYSVSPTITKYMTDPTTVPNGDGNVMGWSADSAYLGLGTTATPFVYIYRRDGTTFTPVSITLPGAPGRTDAISFRQ